LDRAPREDAGASGDRRAAEAAHVGKRLDSSGAEIEEAGGIDRRARLDAHLLGVEDGHWRAERLPLACPLPDLGGALLPGAAVDRAGGLQLAGDLVLVDDLEDGAR